MAKEQGLSLNPSKISGLCGRLMCCLGYEYDSYCEMKRKFPKWGKMVETEAGRGKVVRQNIVKQTVTVQLEEGQEIDVGLDDLHGKAKQPDKTAAPDDKQKEKRNHKKRAPKNRRAKNRGQKYKGRKKGSA
jgi:hypothetical protein